MKRPYLTLKQMAEVLEISENEVLGLCKKKQIPHEITDKGTVWEAYIFIEKDVLTALEGRAIKEEETVKEPEPEKPAEEEATPEIKEPAEEQEKPEEAPEEQSPAEQPSEQTEDERKDPFEEAKEEEPKE